MLISSIDQQLSLPKPNYDQIFQILNSINSSNDKKLQSSFFVNHGSELITHLMSLFQKGENGIIVPLLEFFILASKYNKALINDFINCGIIPFLRQAIENHELQYVSIRLLYILVKSDNSNLIKHIFTVFPVQLLASIPITPKTIKILWVLSKYDSSPETAQQIMNCFPQHARDYISNPTLFSQCVKLYGKLADNPDFRQIVIPNLSSIITASSLFLAHSASNPSVALPDNVCIGLGTAYRLQPEICSWPTEFFLTLALGNLGNPKSFIDLIWLASVSLEVDNPQIRESVFHGQGLPTLLRFYQNDDFSFEMKNEFQLFVVEFINATLEEHVQELWDMGLFPIVVQAVMNTESGSPLTSLSVLQNVLHFTSTSAPPIFVNIFKYAQEEGIVDVLDDYDTYEDDEVRVSAEKLKEFFQHEINM